ncbi:MAG: O-antigen ligase family protein [Chloroflexi bacterium]|nr:O-antigen ligase family protein [Chloroflexota bacterium]
MKNSMRFAFNTADLSRILWGATMLTIPVTSFRWFPFLGEGTLVRPLAMYPLALLIPLLLIQWRRRKVKLGWANALIPLGALILFIVAVTCLGALIDPVPLRGQIYSGRAIRALITISIGLAFFISAIWMNKNEDDLRFTVRWLFAGLCLDIAWSGLQAVTYYTELLDREMVAHWQLAFSVRELIRTNRISGMAYEPAWLAGQFATIFIPFLFASVLTNFRVTRLKWLEPVLLVLSMLTLLATYSRGGLLITLAVMGLTFLFFGRSVLRAIWNWFMNGFNKLLDILVRVVLIGAIAGSLTGSLVFLNQKDIFRRILDFNAASLSEYMVNIEAGARGAYMTSAFAEFEDHPLTGVGLGASGFYMYQNLPDWSLTTVPEIAKQLDPSNRLYPNPKNLYIRLLAETGLIGFILFLAFQFHILGDMLGLLRRKETWVRFALVAGVFAWLAITFYNFTQDSLTTPNIWLVPGVLVGLSGWNAVPTLDKET